jgi:hypothetical protein
LPDWYLDEPQISHVDYFYIKAFYDLSTCRINGMGLGVIPWTAIKKYAEHYSLDFDITESLIDIIREMDSAYIDFQNKETEKNSKNTVSKNRSHKK